MRGKGNVQGGWKNGEKGGKEPERDMRGKVSHVLQETVILQISMWT
jgi:hypothetical protein